MTKKTPRENKTKEEITEELKKKDFQERAIEISELITKNKIELRAELNYKPTGIEAVIKVYDHKYDPKETNTEPKLAKV